MNIAEKNVIIATGAHARPIGCKGEGQFRGKGVSYCATCDANFFEDFEVYVVGGGDSAVEEAMYLTKFARKVTIIHRRDELRAAKSIQEKAFKNPKLFFMWDSVVEELEGDDILQAMYVKNVKTGEVTKVEADPEDGMFGRSDLSERFRIRRSLKESLIWMKEGTLRRMLICIPIFRGYMQPEMYV